MESDKCAHSLAPARPPATPPADLELVNYGAGHAWLRPELDAAIRDAVGVDQVLTQLLNRGRRPEPHYVITDEGRRALDEAARERAMHALFGSPWPTLAEVQP